ncbi:hypothetical protein [unidentified bacterial endosymbiont]|uniref:hypothetical protein n=1 Tax=unidentified bacterial endosymbiont TaxID=2355 RepID=UPI00209E6F1C|nr:hypothetical protein [unidentified bacterial endosymbiont]
MNNNLKIPLQEGVLFKKAHRDVYCNADRILDEAKNQAKKIIKEAQSQQELIRRYAYVQGYQEGIGQASDAVLRFLTVKEEQMRNLYIEMEKELMAFLGNVIHDKSVVLQALETWVSELTFKTGNSVFRILAPQELQAFKPQLVRKVNEVFDGSVIIQYHEQNRFVMSYGDQLAEFDYNDLIAQYARALLKDKNLKEICNAFSSEGIESLKDQINHTAIPANNMIAEDEHDLSNSKNQRLDFHGG